MAAEPIVIHSPPETGTARSGTVARATVRPFPVEPDAGESQGPSEFFCSNPRCDLHVRVDDPNVKGFGDWAILESGITVSHRWVRGELLCDLCAAQRLKQHRTP